MSAKVLVQIENPVTQSADAVLALIAYQTFGKEPAEMPPFYRLGAEMVLVQSNKKDVYYVCTPNGCSCPSATYHPGQACKHQRKYFPQPRTEAAEVSSEGPLRLARPPKGSIRPAGGWVGPNGERANGPVEA